MATQPKTTGLTYEDLRNFPDDNLRREIIDGELFVTPSPLPRHQRVVLELAAALLAYSKERGGAVYPAPLDVFFSETNVVEPDVLFIRPEHVDTSDSEKIISIPDLLIEVSSPSTRRTDLTRKKDLYELFGVPEYWFVDPRQERVVVFRIDPDEPDYPWPGEDLGPGEVVESLALPGLRIAVDDLLGAERRRRAARVRRDARGAGVRPRARGRAAARPAAGDSDPGRRRIWGHRTGRKRRGAGGMAPGAPARRPRRRSAAAPRSAAPWPGAAG